MDNLYKILIGVIPALLWLWFWLKEDNLHPEPRKMLALSFIAGGICVAVAIILEGLIKELFVINDTYLYISWAFIEEIVKFIALVIVVMPSKYMDEPIDAMIYIITVAIGFSAIENVLYVIYRTNVGELSGAIINSNLRFLGATLLHIVSSSSIGFMLGITFYKNAFMKVFGVIIGVILATTLHSAFNLAIIGSKTEESTLKIFGWVWLAAVIIMILFEEIKSVKPKTIL